MKSSRAVSIVLVTGTAWVFFEWLFFVTKPSFMSLYSPWEKLSVLSGTAAIVTAALLIISVPFFLIGRLLQIVSHWRVPVFLLAFLPVLVLLTMAMLVLDAPDVSAKRT